MVEKVGRGKCWPGHLFLLFPRIFEEVFGIIKTVEKVGLADFSTIFVMYKASSEIRGAVELQASKP